MVAHCLSCNQSMEAMEQLWGLAVAGCMLLLQAFVYIGRRVAITGEALYDYEPVARPRVRSIWLSGRSIGACVVVRVTSGHRRPCAVSLSTRYLQLWSCRGTDTHIAHRLFFVARCRGPPT